MNTVNIVLIVILAAMIGFLVGNSYGKYSMKFIINNFIKNLMQMAIDDHEKQASKD